MDRYSKYKYRPDRDYRAKYLISNTNSAGDVTSVYSLMIDVPGKWIVRYGVKSTIEYYAKKNKLEPGSYECDILED